MNKFMLKTTVFTLALIMAATAIASAQTLTITGFPESYNGMFAVVIEDSKTNYWAAGYNSAAGKFTTGEIVNGQVVLNTYRANGSLDNGLNGTITLYVYLRYAREEVATDDFGEWGLMGNRFTANFNRGTATAPITSSWFGSINLQQWYVSALLVMPE